MGKRKRVKSFETLEDLQVYFDDARYDAKLLLEQLHEYPATPKQRRYAANIIARLNRSINALHRNVWFDEIDDWAEKKKRIESELDEALNNA